MPLSAPQQTIADSNKRYVAVCSGRRFGKTHMVRRTLCKWASEPDRLVWAIYPTYRQGKQVLFKSLKRKLSELRWIKKVNETDLNIELINGSVIAIRGADAADKLRGVKLYGAVFDEYATIDPEVFQEIISPALSDSKGSAHFYGTPAGFDHFYDLFEKGKSLNDWDTFQYTTAEGGFVDQEEIESARTIMDERTWQQEYFAKFVNYTGIVSTITDANIVNKPEVEAKGQILVGIDFNLDPISATIAVRTSQDELHVIDEIEMYGSRTEELAEEIKRRYPGHRVIAFPDASGGHRSTNSNMTDHMILRNAGFDVKAPKTNPSIRNRINALNSKLCNARNEHQVTIEPKCKRTIECLRKLPYRKGTNLPDKTMGLDHLFDSVSYMVHYLWPIRLDTASKTTKMRWGM
jgi:hypothetical protein|tara:strand:+ start:417 stop:1634 length:1218 start_codon:yes stop_codon:yes gene_type:complete